MMDRRLKQNPCHPERCARRRWTRCAVKTAVRVAVVLLAYGWLTDTVSAVIVHYYDEQGRIHYINTDYMLVPERYRWQVEEQLRRKGPLDEDRQKSRNETADPAGEKTSDARQAASASVDPFAQKKVEFFTRPGCTECYRLEMLLRAHKIPYIRYDVTCEGEGCPRSPHGVPSGTPPLTRVGDVVIQGKDIQAISQAYEAMIAAHDEPAVEKPPARERKRRR